MLDRRGFLLLAGSGVLAACGGPPEPGPATVTATGAAGMNPGPDGSDRPVILNLVQLRAPGGFTAAEMFALQADPAAALAADFVAMEQIAVAPGQTASTSITVPPDVPYLGFMAMLREPGGRVWCTVIPVAPDSTVSADVVLDAAGHDRGDRLSGGQQRMAATGRDLQLSGTAAPRRAGRRP